MEKICGPVSELQCREEEVKICVEVEEDDDGSGEGSGEDSTSCTLKPQQVCELEEVEKCSIEPVCKKFVKTIRTPVCSYEEEHNTSS